MLPPLTRSAIEEYMSVMYLIAGILAWHADIKWLAIVLFVKSGLDALCSIRLAIVGVRKR